MNKQLSLDFGLMVRSIRIEQKLSQEQLANKAGVHRTYIGMIERGEKNITLENISKICDGLGLSIENLFRELNK